MRKILVYISCILLIAFSTLSFAAWTNIEDYKAYKKAKELAVEAEGAGDTFNAVANYIKAAQLAGKSATPDIQLWQYNNAAYSLIKQFKILTGYEEKLQKLSEMKTGKEKIVYQTEIAELFNLQANLLDEAENILNEGKGLLKEEEPAETANTKEAKSTTGPKDKIESNLQFINWVKEFIKNNLKQEAETTSQTKPAEEKKK